MSDWLSGWAKVYLVVCLERLDSSEWYCDYYLLWECSVLSRGAAMPQAMAGRIARCHHHQRNLLVPQTRSPKMGIRFRSTNSFLPSDVPVVIKIRTQPGRS